MSGISKGRVPCTQLVADAQSIRIPNTVSVFIEVCFGLQEKKGVFLVNVDAKIARNAQQPINDWPSEFLR